MLTEMKRLIFVFLFFNTTYFSFAQDNYLLIRVIPTKQSALITIEQLEQITTKSTGDAIVFGILSDRSGMIIIKTDTKSPSFKLENYTTYISPLSINYNVICKVAKERTPLLGTFVQYNTDITKFNVQYVPELQNAHYNYIKQLKAIGSVLLEGNFDNDDGGMMLIEGKIEDEVIFSDPTIQSGFISPEIFDVSLISVNTCD